MSYSVPTVALDWALAHVRREGDSDFFPPAFEFKAIEAQWAGFRATLAGLDLHAYAPAAPRTVIAPKGYYGFRYVTQLAPGDTLLYLAMLHQAGPLLEAVRVPRDRGIAHSFRLALGPAGELWDPAFDYGSFQKATEQMLDARGVSHVAETDITDFYHRIYAHRLEGALERAMGRGNSLAGAITRFRAALFQRETHRGLPVGPAPSALLAEATIADVDDYLLSCGLKFLRFNDDYRFFCDSEGAARTALRLLAEFLWARHGLTLQASKTSVMRASKYRKVRFPEPKAVEARLADVTHRLFGGKASGPGRKYEELDAGERAEVDRLDLDGLIKQALGQDATVDISLFRLALGRITTLGRGDLANLLIDELPRLFPVIPNVVRFLGVFNALNPADREAVGRRVIAHLRAHAGSGLSDFEAMWLLSLFCDGGWNNVNELAELRIVLRSSDLAQRKVALALGRLPCSPAHLVDFKKHGIADPWVRRAAIFATRSLPPDERTNYWRFLDSQISDPLDRVVLEWVRTTV